MYLSSTVRMAVTELGAHTKALPIPNSVDAPINHNRLASVYIIPAIHTKDATTEPKPITDSTRGLMRSAKGPTMREPSPAATAMGTIINPAVAESNPRPVRNHIIIGSICEDTAKPMVEIENAPSE